MSPHREERGLRAGELRRSHRSWMFALEDEPMSSISEAIELTRELIPLALEEQWSPRLHHKQAPPHPRDRPLLPAAPRRSDSMIEVGDIDRRHPRIGPTLGPSIRTCRVNNAHLARIRAYLEAARTKVRSGGKVLQFAASAAHYPRPTSSTRPTCCGIGYTARREAPYSPSPAPPAAPF